MSDTSVSTKVNSLKTPELIALICFVLSGFAALVYEISWIRKASVIVGGTTYAVSTVLAVFFAGRFLSQVFTNTELTVDKFQKRIVIVC